MTSCHDHHVVDLVIRLHVRVTVSDAEKLCFQGGDNLTTHRDISVRTKMQRNSTIPIGSIRHSTVFPLSNWKRRIGGEALGGRPQGGFAAPLPARRST